MAGNNSHQQGSVKDPQNDGRLKENRDEGRTKSTTPASAARAEQHGHSSGSGSQHSNHSSDTHASGSKAGGSHSGGSDSKRSEPQQQGGQNASDLKSREYTDAEGNAHHHTHAYERDHGSSGKERSKS